MKTVTVLLSTYNGKEYLVPQIESLLAQKNVEISILARDDGSSDDTVEILNYYSEKYSLFKYYCGANCGPAKSFLDLIVNAEETDYYAFCDQDDVWDEDKLDIAINKLETCDKTKPALYYSNLRIVDKDLNFYRLSHSVPHISKEKWCALTEPMVTGCTAVFNKRAKQLISENVPSYCTMHDTWIYMLCKFLGTVVYDFDAHISYRQHGNNVIGTYLGKRPLSLYYQRIVRLFDRKLQPRYNNAKSFLECFGKYLEKQDKQKVEEMAHYKDSFLKWMKLLFDTNVHTSSLSGEIRYRSLIILRIV